MSRLDDAEPYEPVQYVDVLNAKDQELDADLKRGPFRWAQGLIGAECTPERYQEILEEELGMEWVKHHCTSGILDKIPGKHIFVSTEKGETKIVAKGRRAVAEFAFSEEELDGAKDGMEFVVDTSRFDTYCFSNFH